MDPNALRDRVWELSRKAGKCRDVQRTLEEADAATVGGLACELREHVWDAMECPQANHVLQKFITVLKPMPKWLMQEIFSRGSQGIETMAKHQFGCRVFLRLLEHCEEEDKERLVECLMANIVNLSKDEFATYCIQAIFEHSNAEQQSEVSHVVTTKAVSASMATHYHAGAVVAKALQCGFTEQSAELAEALLQQGPWLLERMAVHRYGSDAVIQMLGLPQVSERVYRALVPKMWKLQDSEHGSEVLNSDAWAALAFRVHT
jgi:pumilio RNA-binding family